MYSILQVRQELLKRGYVLVVMGGGITGDLQINDTHLHHDLKSKYRVNLLMEQLNSDPGDFFLNTSVSVIITWKRHTTTSNMQLYKMQLVKIRKPVLVNKYK